MTPAASSVPGVSVQIPNWPDARRTYARTRPASAASSRAARSFGPTTRSATTAISIRRASIASTGIVVDQFGNRADLAIVENTNDLKRRYSGVTVSGRYRINSRSDAGGSYTLSRLWGNFDGENTASGPLTTDLFQYPEYREAAWFAPEGDLAADQRHRATLWLNYGVPKIEGLTISVLQDLATGLPYGAGGGLASGQSGFSASAVVDARPVRDQPRLRDAAGRRRARPTTTRRRDAFRTEMSRRTDMARTTSIACRAAVRSRRSSRRRC